MCRTGDQSDLLIRGAQNLQLQKADPLCPSNLAFRKLSPNRRLGTTCAGYGRPVCSSPRRLDPQKSVLRD